MGLVNTLVEDIYAKENELDKNESRPSRYGAWEHFLEDTERDNGIISPELSQKAQMSLGTTLKAPVLDAETVTISNTRPVTITDSENTSNNVTIAWTTYAFGFTMYPMQHENNNISYQRDFKRKMDKYIYQLAKELDTKALTELGLNKTQNLNDDLGYTFAASELSITQAQKDDIWSDLPVMMQANDFYNPVTIIGNSGIQSIAKKQLAHGSANDRDYRQFVDELGFKFTNQIQNGADKVGTMYAVERGNTGVLFRQEWDSIFGSDTTSGKEWDMIQAPYLNIPMGSYYYSDAVDGSSLNGGGADMSHLTRTKKEHFGFSVDVAFVTAYNSDLAGTVNPIILGSIANS